MTKNATLSNQRLTIFAVGQFCFTGRLPWARRNLASAPSSDRPVSPLAAPGSSAHDRRSLPGRLAVRPGSPLGGVLVHVPLCRSPALQRRRWVHVGRRAWRLAGGHRQGADAPFAAFAAYRPPLLRADAAMRSLRFQVVFPHVGAADGHFFARRCRRLRLFECLGAKGRCDARPVTMAVADKTASSRRAIRRCRAKAPGAHRCGKERMDATIVHGVGRGQDRHSCALSPFSAPFSTPLSRFSPSSFTA